MHNVIGVDIGGTFTDFVYYDPNTGQIHNWKNPTTPKEPIEGVLEGLKQVGDLARIDKIRLGTTIATNALLAVRRSQLRSCAPEHLGSGQYAPLEKSWDSIYGIMVESMRTSGAFFGRAVRLIQGAVFEPFRPRTQETNVERPKAGREQDLPNAALAQSNESAYLQKVRV
jgi:hypothetical protein